LFERGVFVVLVLLRCCGSGTTFAEQKWPEIRPAQRFKKSPKSAEMETKDHKSPEFSALPLHITVTAQSSCVRNAPQAQEIRWIPFSVAERYGSCYV
jgi:hypothetical protein